MKSTRKVSFSRGKFILMVGDEGAILLHLKGKKLKQRLFSTADSVEGKQAFAALLANDPGAPVDIVLDILDQSCVQQALPAVSALSINKLVKKRLERDFSPDDIKGAIPLGREKTGRKDWNFMFIAAHVAPPLSTWLDFLNEQHNVITGIYVLPVEAESLMQEVTKVFQKEKIKGKQEWQFLVLHNRISGFRQLVFHNGRMVFTRLIHAAAEELPGVVAGNIEQETLNTLEYLRRLSLPENAKVDIYVCVSQDIKSNFAITAIKGNALTVFTPFEMSEKLKFDGGIQQKDHYADIMFAMNFAKQRHVLRLHTPATRHLAAMNTINLAAKFLVMVMVPLIVAYIPIALMEIWKTQENITSIETRKTEINQKWVQLQASAKQFDENVSTIKDMVTLYTLLSGGAYNPISLIAAFNTVKGSNVLVKDIEWALLESDGRQATGVVGRSTVSLKLNIDFYNSGNSFDTLFASFDAFIKRVQSRFSNYSVEYTQLPDRLALSDQNKVLPIQITIIGPR